MTRYYVRTMIESWNGKLRKPYRGTRVISNVAQVAKRLRSMRAQAETWKDNPNDYAVRAYRTCVVEVTALEGVPGWSAIKNFECQAKVSLYTPEQFIQAYQRGIIA